MRDFIDHKPSQTCTQAIPIGRHARMQQEWHESSAVGQLGAGQTGVIDIRSLYIETDDEIVRRIHKVLEYIEPERVFLTTDCGLKALPRFVAFEKLKALVRAANRVRTELPARTVATAPARREVRLC